jgi:hypothetical protein
MRPALLALAIALCPAAGVRAETVDEIVARHVEARGGAKRLKALGSVRMTGRVRADGGRRASVVREVSRPGRMRLEFTAEGVTSVYAFDGAHGWQIAPMLGGFAPEPMTPDAEQLAAEQADIEGPLVDWKAKGHRVELVGREAIDGRPVYRLRLTLKGGAILSELIDAQSLLEVRRLSTRHVRGATVEVETDFSDYREVGGLRFPHAIDSFATGRAGHLAVVVETIELDPALDAARFRRP